MRKDHIAVQKGNRNDRIIYPKGCSAITFFDEASKLRTEFFNLKMELRDSKVRFEKEWEVKSGQIEKWIEHTSKQMGILSQQIDELESNRGGLSLRTVSRWAFSGVTGDIAWESLKWAKDIIKEMLA
jgi:hypothetical protein